MWAAAQWSGRLWPLLRTLNRCFLVLLCSQTLSITPQVVFVGSIEVRKKVMVAAALLPNTIKLPHLVFPAVVLLFA